MPVDPVYFDLSQVVEAFDKLKASMIVVVREFGKIAVDFSYSFGTAFPHLAEREKRKARHRRSYLRMMKNRQPKK